MIPALNVALRLIAVAAAVVAAAVVSQLRLSPEQQLQRRCCFVCTSLRSQVSRKSQPLISWRREGNDDDIIKENCGIRAQGVRERASDVRMNGDASAVRLLMQMHSCRNRAPGAVGGGGGGGGGGGRDNGSGSGGATRSWRAEGLVITEKLDTQMLHVVQ